MRGDKTNGGVPKSPLSSLAVIAAMLLAGESAFALDPGTLPTGGQITAGSASIAVGGTRMTVDQASQQMIANWNSFFSCDSVKRRSAFLNPVNSNGIGTLPGSMV
ncbi:MAG: hypothetical protein JZU70_05880 [Chlorobium sp.]|nr:hypothetical protein [Chlorobium sp.]